MLQQLPDIASTDTAASPGPLEWVGMSGIDLPVAIREANYHREHHARIDASVNLPRPDVRGIHMSRLYRLVDELGDGPALTPSRLETLLGAMTDSHRGCGSDRARVRLSFELLVRRGALKTADIGGWHRYPIAIDAVGPIAPEIRAEVEVTYSSTCPCSASLARQLIKREFLNEFSGRKSITAADAAAWLQEHGTLATPHGQRSVAHVGVDVAANAASFGFLDLIQRAERALATPVQTAVKRIDEQAFAARNGQNLMFVEDAARRVQEAMAGHYDGVRVDVAHMESLHPHDAVASARS